MTSSSLSCWKKENIPSYRLKNAPLAKTNFSSDGSICIPMQSNESKASPAISFEVVIPKGFSGI